MQPLVNHVTAVIFYPRIAIPNGAAFANDFIQRTGEALNHEPVVLPMNQPSPPQAPRIILRSKDGEHVCEFSLDRVSFHYANRRRRSEPLAALFPRYRGILYQVLTTLGEMLDERPVRLGFVVKMLRPTGGPATEALRERFVQGDWLDEAREAQVHVRHQIDLEGTPCNRWTRLLTAPPPPNEPGAGNMLLFDLDVNTRAEYAHRFEGHEVVSFFLEAYEHVRQEADRWLAFSENGEG
jgi:hypothetical protein